MRLTEPVGPAQLSLGALALILALAAIGGAWAFQLIGGYQPCALCLEQREPYYVGLPLLIIALAITKRMPEARFTRLLYLLFAAIFAYGFALAAYHAGAEWQFWAGPTDCGSTVEMTTDASSLLTQLQGIKLVSCTEAAGRFLGISFAGWNAVATLAVTLLGLKAAFGAAGRD
ncbi:MAG: disulfide bond formation protein B [Hyphomicrobiales bacterium]|nr:disulfide bond formation protein B [Hyphomicrobiales bacterium]PCJ91924.1 MAG: disulfide bond formation protein B [Hyphomicrobiales bacterium]